MRLSVLPLVSTFQKIHPGQPDKVPTTYVKLERATITTNDETGVVDVDWKDIADIYPDALISDRSINSGKTKLVFSVCFVPFFSQYLDIDYILPYLPTLAHH